MRRSVLMAAVMVAALGLPASAGAADRWVDGLDGSDSNTGADLAQALKTIQAAINLAADGDTIHVVQGTYEPIGLNIPATKPGLTIKGHGRVVLQRAAGLTGLSTIGITVGAARTTIEGLEITGFQTGVWTSVGGATVAVADLRIARCTFRVLTHVASLAGIGTVEGCVMTDIDRFGVALSGSGSQWAIRNCTFYRIKSSVHNSTSAGVWNSDGLFVRVTNCAFVDVSIAIHTLKGELHHNAYFANKVNFDGTPPSQGSDVFSDPKFTDPLRGVFLLQPDSPLVNAGEVVNGTVTHIGAGGIGAVASENYGQAPPADAPPFALFANWFDATGGTPVPMAESLNFEVDAQGNLKLKPIPVDFGIARSPVVDTASIGTVLRSLGYLATENETDFPSGSRRRIGETDSRLPIVRVRASGSPFEAGDTAIGWTPVERNADLSALGVAGRYFQVQLVLSRQGK